ncbi:hypothetical protein D3C79_806040 [compost metagenome]
MRALAGKLALPHVTHTLAPIHLALAQGLLDISTRQTALAQLFANTRRAVAGAGTVADEAFEVAGFAKQPFFGEPVELRLDQLIRSAALTQLARQLDATVLTSREQVHGCPPNGDGGVEYGGHNRLSTTAINNRLRHQPRRRPWPRLRQPCLLRRQHQP